MRAPRTRPGCCPGWSWSGPVSGRPPSWQSRSGRWVTDRGANHQNTNHNRQKGEFTMPKLDGKVAVITGATSGMALATAKLFVAEGAHVFITGRRKDKVDEAVAAIGHNVTGVQADSGNLNDLARLAETVLEHHRRVDVLFPSPGTRSVSDPPCSITPGSVETPLALNLR